MDLRNLASTVTLTTANEPNELGDVLEQYPQFMRDFSNLVMVVQVNSLAEADQDSLKSAFIYKWAKFMQLMQQFKSNMTLDTTVERSISSADAFVATNGAHSLKFKGCAYYSSGGWSDTICVYTTGFTQTELSAIVTTPSTGRSYFVFFDSGRTSGNQYLVLECATGTLGIDTTHSEMAAGDINYLHGWCLVKGLSAMITTTETIDVTVDLLSEYFKVYDTMVDVFDSVVTALALSA
jgi:hypothetical protein